MITSILNDALVLKNETPDKLQEYLHSINVNTFDPIFHNSQNLLEAKQKILYILCAYSEDSPLLILRQDSKEEKEGICEYLEIPVLFQKRLMDLSEPEVRRATTDYVGRFAGPLFKSLMFLKIQQQDFDLDITNRAFEITTTETDKEGKETTTRKFDPKEHMKAVTEYEKLSRKIHALENELKAQIKRMEGIDNLKEFVRSGKDSGKIKGIRTGNVENVTR